MQPKLPRLLKDIFNEKWKLGTEKMWLKICIIWTRHGSFTEQCRGKHEDGGQRGEGVFKKAKQKSLFKLILSLVSRQFLTLSTAVLLKCFKWGIHLS